MQIKTLFPHTASDGEFGSSLYSINWFHFRNRVLECMMYSLNNLLERFHHALWFYLLGAADLYIPLAFYIGPVIALSVSLIVYVRFFSFLLLHQLTNRIIRDSRFGYEMKESRG